MSDPQVVVHADADVLAAAVAARLITALVDAQALRGSASVVLTGGGVGTAVLRQLRDSPARDAVDWGRLDVWWGDERWVPAADPQRNDLAAREALLDAVPLDPARVHPFPAADGPYAGDPSAAAAAYAAELADAARAGAAGTAGAAVGAPGAVDAAGAAGAGDAAGSAGTAGAAGAGGDSGSSVPRFDVLLLGVGEEGHVASIFPDSPAASDQHMVAAVRDCPKPPPTRLTLTFPAIRAAAEVWLVTAGAAKAAAIAQALAGADPLTIPAAGARGRTATRYLLDTSAAPR